MPRTEDDDSDKRHYDVLHKVSSIEYDISEIRRNIEFFSERNSKHEIKMENCINNMKKDIAEIDKRVAISNAINISKEKNANNIFSLYFPIIMALIAAGWALLRYIDGKFEEAKHISKATFAMIVPFIT